MPLLLQDSDLSNLLMQSIYMVFMVLKLEGEYFPTYDDLFACNGDTAPVR
jgi:hypothetical protein